MAEPGPVVALRPPLPWRLASAAVMGSVGALSRAFLYGCNSTQVTGLDGLLRVLDRRREQGRERGLLTVCNHVGVLDDPVMWGILPLRYAVDPANLRWGLGAHDICFKNKFTSTFFSLGQILPTHRLWHSPHGGPYQPTMSEALRILSAPETSSSSSSCSSISKPRAATVSPLSLTYTTIPDLDDAIPRPSAYLSHHYAWLHVFPEACCHQGTATSLRYFKWGVARLILESEPAPEFIPMFIDGIQHVMPENRSWPRWAPRMGKRIRVAIGEPTDVDALFGAERKEWQSLVRSHRALTRENDSGDKEEGRDEALRDGDAARELRTRVAKKVRDEVQKLRVGMGLPEETDETAGLAETWAKEPNKRRFKSDVDGSLVNRRL